jgi:hypothetical protein
LFAYRFLADAIACNSNIQTLTLVFTEYTPELVDYLKFFLTHFASSDIQQITFEVHYTEFEDLFHDWTDVDEVVTVNGSFKMLRKVVVALGRTGPQRYRSPSFC